MKQPIHVYFGVRAERDLYLTEHFQALAERHSNLTFAPVLSEAPSAQYRSGLVTQAVAEDLSDLDGWKAYVAGPPPMVDAAMEMAFALGLHRQDMHATCSLPRKLPALATAEWCHRRRCAPLARRPSMTKAPPQRRSRWGLCSFIDRD